MGAHFYGLSQVSHRFNYCVDCDQGDNFAVHEEVNYREKFSEEVWWFSSLQLLGQDAQKPVQLFLYFLCLKLQVLFFFQAG